MIPKGFLTKRCVITLSATVLCSLVPLVYSGTTVLQTPAQDRFWESLFGGWGSSPPPAPPHSPPMNIPDVAGFGMYPLWKFHKFDGLSLRPVPYGVDIGSGIPSSPDPPAFPTGFLSSPAPSTPTYYGPPSNPPATNYEASSAPNYGSSAPAQNAVPNYGKFVIEAPHPSSYNPNAINFSYKPVIKYLDQPAYNATAAPSYRDSQTNGQQQSNGVLMNSPQTGYDGGQYGAGSGINIQFAPAPQEYGMPPHQQQQPNYNPQPSASYPMPAFATIENPMSVSYPPMQEPKPMQMDNGYGGGFLKRSSSSFDKDAPKNSESEASDDGSYNA